MTRRGPSLAALAAAVPILLAGCTASSPPGTASSPPGTASSPPSTPPSMAPGMVLPDGGPMPGAASGAPAQPSASALMVCGPEIQEAVRTLLGLPAAPPSSSTWAESRFTCTYQLATGPLVLVVRESGSEAAARTDFDQLRQRLGPTQPLSGLDSLGLPAFTTSSGSVAFAKDDKVLQVDASGLPAQVGSPPRPPAELAYAVASDVLGCWTGK